MIRIIVVIEHKIESEAEKAKLVVVLMEYYTQVTKLGL